MNALSHGLLRHVGALAPADMSASGKAATCRRSPKAFWLLLLSLLLFSASLRAEFDPAVVKVMEKAEIFGTKPFAGDVAVNSNGQWIAASQHGVFLSSGGGTLWQEILTATGAKIVNANTVNIQCRISDSGSWVVISRAGIYKNSAANPYVGEAVTNTVGINQVYDVDMAPNGNWIASSSQGTWRFLTSTGTTSLILASAHPGNGSLSPKRIVKINSNGDWAIMTSAGVYKNAASVLSNPSSSNIGGNILYWSLDFNAQGDWIAVSSRGAFLNGTELTVTPNFDGSTTIEANDIGEMVVKITDRDLSGNFIWMAISPKGIYRNGERIPGLSFLPNQEHYALDMNNSGIWLAASESAALLNGNPITNDGFSIQTDNGVANELLLRINDFGDYACLTNNGLFRNENRGLTNAKQALLSTFFSPTSFKHVLSLGSNGAVALLSEHTSVTDRTGVYHGGNVLNPVPPQPLAASLVGTLLDWTGGGGSTAGYIVSMGTDPQPTSASQGSTLYVGTNDQFNIANFADFTPGVVHYIVLAAINSDGVESSPLIVIPYQAPPLEVTAQNFDTVNQQVTLSWTSLPGKSYRVEKSLHLTDDWQPLTEIPPGNAATSQATVNPPEWTMTRTFSDPTMTTKGFYRVKTPP